MRQTKHTLWLSALLLCLLSLPLHLSHANDNTTWQAPEYLLKAFKEIALKNEYAPTQGQIIKWTKPVHYRFVYHDLAQNTLVENLFREQLAHLAQITQHPIQTEKDKANFTIHLTRDEHYASVIQNHTSSTVPNLGRESHCMGSYSHNKKGEITSAQIVIPVDHLFARGLLVSCIVEETTQLMGLPNDSDWVHPSIANDASKIEFLTGLDYILLKILYSKQIHTGIKGKALDNKIKRRISELEKMGEIKKASQTVNEYGLYPFVH